MQWEEKWNKHPVTTPDYICIAGKLFTKKNINGPDINQSWKPRVNLSFHYLAVIAEIKKKDTKKQSPGSVLTFKKTKQT